MNSKEILKRRKSVTNTKKITRTMEMVSTARFKKTSDRIKAARPYGERLLQLVREVAGTVAGGESGQRYPLLEERAEVKRIGLLLITANRGLCGGYNNNVINAGRKLRDARMAAGQEVDLYVSGKKGLGFFRFFGTELAGSYIQFEDKPAYEETEPIAADFIQQFIDGKIDELHLVYTQFLSSARQKVVTEQLLPITLPQGGGDDQNKAVSQYIFEPSAEQLLETLIPLSFKTAFFTAFLHAAASEQVSRMIAMKNATDAAEKMITSLTRQYNRARQTQITMEIAELIGGAEVLK